MRQIRVCNRKEAERDYRSYDAVISVIDQPAEIDHPNHLEELFADLSEPIGDNWPKKHNVENIIRFAKKIPNDSKTLVHCGAGISRSTATAAVVMKVWGIGDEEIFETLISQHPKDRIFYPNPLILFWADRILESNLEESFSKLFVEVLTSSR
jgi:predicted protein tyrosine phosphatase